MSGANYKYLTHPSAIFSRFTNIAYDKSILENELGQSLGKGQIGGYKIY